VAPEAFAERPGLPGLAGAQGPQGAQGPAGAKGDKGDPGGDGFENSICSSIVVGCTETAPVISQTTPAAASFFLSRSLPAGSYIVVGQAIVQATDLTNPDWRVGCHVRAPMSAPVGAAYVGFGWATVGDGPGNSNVATITIVFGATLASADSAAMRCWRDGGSGAMGTGANPVVVYADISAVQVRNLTIG
jgi:hypothetical protein